MRRGIGVAYTQNNVAKQKQLADLGETIQAERIGTLTNELDALTAALQKLADEHKDRVKEDPILRARFRQLAQVLGADILSSRENLFSKQSGLDDFYYGLATEVVQVCISESTYTGPYVPMRSVLGALRRMRGSSATTEITEDDVVAALARLSILGGEYATVHLGGEVYINTVSSSGAKGDGLDTVTADSEAIMAAVGALFTARRRSMDGSLERDEAHRRAIASYNFRIGGSLSLNSSHPSAGSGNGTGEGMPSAHHLMSASGRRSSQPPQNTQPEAEPALAFQPALTLQEIREALPPYLAQTAAVRRVEVALQLLIRGGQIWVDVDPSVPSVKGSAVEQMCEPAVRENVTKRAVLPSSVLSSSGTTTTAAHPHPHSAGPSYTYTSGGAMTTREDASGFTIVSKTAAGHSTTHVLRDEANSDGPRDGGKGRAIGGGGGSSTIITSADVMEHPAVKYWFVNFL